MPRRYAHVLKDCQPAKQLTHSKSSGAQKIDESWQSIKIDIKYSKELQLNASKLYGNKIKWNFTNNLVDSGSEEKNVYANTFLRALRRDFLAFYVLCMCTHTRTHIHSWMPLQMAYWCGWLTTRVCMEIRHTFYCDFFILRSLFYCVGKAV